MSPTLKKHCKQSLAGTGPSSSWHRGCSLWLSLAALICSFPALAQSGQSLNSATAPNAVPEAQNSTASSCEQPVAAGMPGSISGTVVDPAGSLLVGVRVGLTREDQAPSQEVLSGDHGEFSFGGIAPGPYQLTVGSEGFSTRAVTGILRPGEACIVPEIALAIAPAYTEMRVAMTRVEMAEAEVKEEEKQRVLGFIPNFYVSYDPHAVPLTPRQKFELAWRTSVDPVSFGIVGAIAGLQQASNEYSGYGQGAQGFGKRYGAAYADFVAGTFIGGAALPSLFKQDPRYFYKGTGSKHSRLMYAIANAVVCKGDNGRWQANYSGILGSLAAGGISNLYYPANERGASLVFENALVGIGASAAANVFQEFVVRRLTPRLSPRAPAQP